MTVFKHPKSLRTVSTLILASVFLTTLSCKKNQECSDPELITLTASTPVYEGWPLYLTTQSGSEYSYTWNGPNGWHKESSYSNMNGTEVIDSMTSEKAGRYVVELKDGKCIVKRGIVDVAISPVPTPPCSIANNSSTTNLGGVGGVTYTYINCGSSGSTYTVQASAGTQAITFNFDGDHPPLPGVYKTEAGYYPSWDSKNKVAVYIGTGFQDFIIKQDYDVYVNKVNGKTVISFCNAGFSNPVGSTNIVISAKVTLP